MIARINAKIELIFNKSIVCTTAFIKKVCCFAPLLFQYISYKTTFVMIAHFSFCTLSGLKAGLYFSAMRIYSYFLTSSHKRMQHGFRMRNAACGFPRPHSYYAAESAISRRNELRVRMRDPHRKLKYWKSRVIIILAPVDSASACGIRSAFRKRKAGQLSACGQLVKDPE